MSLFDDKNLKKSIHRSATTTSNLISKLNFCSLKNKFSSLKFLASKKQEEKVELPNKKALHRTSRTKINIVGKYLKFNSHF